MLTLNLFNSFINYWFILLHFIIALDFIFSFIRIHVSKKKMLLISVTSKDGGMIFLVFTRKDQPSGIGPAVFLRVSSVE